MDLWTLDTQDGETSTTLNSNADDEETISDGPCGQEPWGNRHAASGVELQRIRLVTLRLPGGTVSQRTQLTAQQQSIVESLGLAQPPRYHAFEPIND